MGRHHTGNLTCRRLGTVPGMWPPMRAASDMLGENTHACLLLQGSQLRTAPWCTDTVGGLWGRASEPHERRWPQPRGCRGSPWVAQEWGNPPHPRAHPQPFPSPPLRVQHQAGGRTELEHLTLNFLSPSSGLRRKSLYCKGLAECHANSNGRSRLLGKCVWLISDVCLRQ